MNGKKIVCVSVLFFSVFISCILFAGCYTKPKRNRAYLEVGMTRAEVRNLLGNPNSTRWGENNITEHWFYQAWRTEDQIYITFRDGRVESFRGGVGGGVYIPPTTSSGSSTSTNNNSQQTQPLFQSPIDGGTYRLSGQNLSLRFTTLGSSGMVSYTDANGRASMISYSINENMISFNFPSGLVTGQIVSRTSFATNDGLWTRTGF